MPNYDLVKKGLVPETINLIQAARVADGIKPDDMIDILENDDRVKYRKLDTGEYEIDTLSLLDYLDGFHEHFVASLEQERLEYLMDVKQENPNPCIQFTSFKEDNARHNQEKNNV